MTAFFPTCSDRVLLILRGDWERRQLATQLDAAGFAIDACDPERALSQARGQAYAVVVFDLATTGDRVVSVADTLSAVRALQLDASLLVVAGHEQFGAAAQAVNGHGASGIIAVGADPTTIVSAVHRAFVAYARRRELAYVAACDEQRRRTGALQALLGDCLANVVGTPEASVATERTRIVEQVNAWLLELADAERHRLERAAMQRRLQRIEARSTAAPAGSVAPVAETGAALREHPRALLAVPVTLRAGDRTCAGVAENVSIGGMFVTGESVGDSDGELLVEFQLPGDGATVRAAAEIMWRRAATESPRRVSAGLGLRFRALDVSSRSAIAAYIDSWNAESDAQLDKLAI